jgi:hypothetical protein
VQKLILGIVVASLAAGCGPVTSTVSPPDTSPAVAGGQPLPYAQVTVGPVHAFVPTGWQTVPVGSPDNIRGGFISSPKPEAWGHMDGSITGMTASWVDATRVGVPSDYYYLAARDLLLSRLRAGAGCRVLSQHYVVVAVVQNSARADVQLRKLIARPSFGGARVPDLVAAVSH